MSDILPEYINSDIESFVLTSNAYFHFRQFISELKSKGISNNGENFVFNEIDKYCNKFA